MLEHGGNLAEAANQYNIPLEHWLDLSTGINPNGYLMSNIPASVWQKLPLDNDGLEEAACSYYGCQFALPTAGSQAALQVLPQLRPSSKIAMPDFMYQEHANAWRRYGHTVIKFDARPDENTIKNADVVLLCNPNNPTATQFSVAELLNWHAKLAKRGGWLIVDEAFMDVTPEYSIAQYAHLENLFVLCSLGKFYGLAGARVGFLLGAKQALLNAQDIIGPWSIAGPSRWIAKHALMDKAWQDKTRLLLTEASHRLATLLTQYGLAPAAGTALFQFVPTPQAVAWQQYFAKQGIWLRLFNNPSALRFGLPPENAWGLLEVALKNFKKN